MEVTRAVLEQIIGDLKGREGFRLRGRNLNREYDELDVFPAVDDAALAEFSPTDEGEAEAYMLWGRAADKAFAEGGALTRPLAIRWGGERNALQMAFARRGLTVRIDCDAEASEDYPESGTLVLSPRSGSQSCDLLRLIATFAQLEAQGVIALARAGSTQSAGWESVGERERDEAQTAVFWHDQSHEVFDGLGQLARPMMLYWRGDANLVCEVLEAAGFPTVRPDDDSVAIEIAAPPGTVPAIETYAEALQATSAAPAKRARKPRGPAGPFAELHRYRAPDRNKPVWRLAFEPGGAGLAVAQVSGRRGPTTHALCRIDAATGAVTRAFAPLSPMTGTCGGCRFLPDGRLVYSFYDFLPTARLGSAQPAMRLLVWEPDGDGEREIAVHPLSHLCNYGLMSVDAAGEHVAVVSDSGASILRVGPIGAARWSEVARVGGPPVDAYPLVALSPDARRVAWTADGASVLLCVGREDDGGEPWVEAVFPGHSGGRSTRSLAFAPSGDALVALCLRSIYGATSADGKVDVQEDRRLQCYAVSDGSRSHAALEQATAGLTTFAWHPDGARLAIGTSAGELVLFGYPDGERLASQRVFAKGGVSAIAFDGSGGRVVVGGEKGELAVLAVT